MGFPGLGKLGKLKKFCLRRAVFKRISKILGKKKTGFPR